MPPLTGVCEPYGPRVTWYCIAATHRPGHSRSTESTHPRQGSGLAASLVPHKRLRATSCIPIRLASSSQGCSPPPCGPLRTAPPVLVAHMTTHTTRTYGQPVHTNILRTPQTKKCPTRRTHPTRQELTTTARNPNHRPPAATRETTPTAIRWTRHLTQNASPLTASH